MIFGEVFGSYLGLAGKKPTVPDAPEIDIDKELAANVSGNLALLPELSTLARKTNELSVEEMERSLSQALPGYKELRDQITKTIGSQLRGEIPKDVSSLVERTSAEQATRAGYAGSGVGRALTARDLGLTSLDITNRALGAADRWIASVASRTPVFDFRSMFLSPTQRIAVQQWNEENRFMQQTAVNKLAAMPSPTAQAWMGVLRNWDQLTWNVASTAVGFGMGGMGGGGMGGGGGGGGGGFTTDNIDSYGSAFEMGPGGQYYAPGNNAGTFYKPTGLYQ